MNDLQYYQDQGFSREEAKQQVASDRASSLLLISLFSFFFKVFVSFFVFLPAILCAYLILQLLKIHLGTQTIWAYMLWLIGTVYLLECLLFLLKGWYISLKQKGTRVWMILWVLCFLYCFVFPVFLLQVLIFGQFKHTPGHAMSTPLIISWVGAGILGWLIFRRYRLGLDAAPKWMFWAYRLGRRLSASPKTTPAHTV